MDKAEIIEKLIKGSIQRAVLESVAVVIILVAFTHHLQRAVTGSPQYYGCLIILIGSGFIAGVVWSYALSHRLLRVHPATDSTFWRGAFLAQARLLRLVPLWYLTPLCTGMLLFAAPTRPGEHESFLIMLPAVMVLCGGITWLNRRAAGQLVAAAQAFVPDPAPRSV